MDRVSMSYCAKCEGFKADVGYVDLDGKGQGWAREKAVGGGVLRGPNIQKLDIFIPSVINILCVLTYSLTLKTNPTCTF